MAATSSINAGPFNFFQAMDLYFGARAMHSSSAFSMPDEKYRRLDA
jgi:hypothetical protein